MLETLNKILIIIWMNSITSKMIPVRTECWKTFCGNKWRKFTQARKINATRIQIIEVCHLLRIRNRMLHKRYTRLWSICWIRNCYIRNCSTNRRVNADWGFKRIQRFHNQRLSCFKRQGFSSRYMRWIMW